LQTFGATSLAAPQDHRHSLLSVPLAMSNQTAPPLTSLRYRSDEIVITADLPFKNDRLGREPFVKATTDLLVAIREPFVIALNAPWGSGKTTTLRLLEPNLKAAGVTAVSFNAWEVDDATDPLVPLVATLHDRLLEIKGYGSRVDSVKIERLKTLGSAIVKHSAIAAVKVATAGLLDLGVAAEGLAKAAGEAAEKAGEDLAGDVIDAFKRERRAAHQFRALLQELIAYLQATADESVDSPPLVLMIDELDRCRPTFAVSMLERIKHFFGVPGLVFVLALDLEQLKASTRKVYGDELDATEYLRRFIDLELRLPRARVGQMVSDMLTRCGSDAFFEARAKYPAVREDRKWIVQILQNLAEHFELSSRAVQRMVTRLMLVLRQTPENGYLDPILVVFMIFLRIRDEELLRAFVAGRAQADAVMAALHAVKPGGEVFYRSHVGMVIEAHLLYAHNGRHEYVTKFLARANEFDGQANDASSLRMLEVGRRYQHVCSANVERGSLDLERIEQRINLIAVDLQDER
jgi:KAP family P-loop domain